MNRRSQITLAAEYESLARFRKFIDEVCSEEPAFDEDFRYDLKLAVDEACSNIINHGYAGMNPGSIILSLEVGSQQVCMTLTDFGHPFEPSQAPQPDLQAALEDREMGGFGLYFIYQAMDEVDYRTTEGGNQLLLVKRLAPPGNSLREK